jgi:D-serine deaminase-like pyridoxal phosphate-dependent protein
MRITELPTPQVLIDRSKFTANLDRMQQTASAAGLALRPHAKTHKIPALAREQIRRGAVGICCAKVGEAEVFAQAGIEDIRLPYPVHPTNADRILKLMDRGRISIIVDHADVAAGWSDAMEHAGRTLDVLIKIDVGFHRCGIDPHGDALGFVRKIAALPGLRLRGLLSHAGHAYAAGSDEELAALAHAEAETLTGLADLARQSGIAIDEISVGATPTARFSAREPGLTELRPGNYIYYDRTQVAVGSATLNDCALTVLARVVSRPALDRVIFDCGSKTLTTDLARGKLISTEGHGLVFQNINSTLPEANLVIERLSEEHATVRVVSGRSRLEPGDLVRVLPNHSCVVSNLVDRVQVVDGQDVVDTLTVEARGKIQ